MLSRVKDGTAHEPPAFIAGPVRSGTTLLRWILDSHPNVVSRSEQNFLTPVVATFNREFLDAPVGEGFATQKLAMLREQQDLNTPPNEIARRFRRLHESFYHDLCTHCGKRRWADNTHSLLDYLIAALDVMYEQTPLYLIATRHGLDAVLSAQEKFGGDIRKRLEYWCAVVDLHSAFLEAHPGRCLRVKYEELVTDPQMTCDGIFSFLGEEPLGDIENAVFRADHGPYFGDHKIHRTREVHKLSVNRWQTVPPSHYRAAVDDCPQFNALMLRLGYPPV